MYIRNLSLVQSPNAVSSMLRNKNISIIKQESDNTNINSIVLSYPKNYYLSFKGESVHPDKQKFLDYLDRHFERYGNKTLTSEAKDVRLWPEERAFSPEINDKFSDMVEDTLNSIPYCKVEENQVFDAVKDSMNRTLYNYFPEEYGGDHNKFEEDVEQKTSKLITLYKQEKNIPIDEKYKYDIGELRDISLVFKHNIDEFITGRDVRKRVTVSRFYDNFGEHIDKFKVKLYDKSVLDEMKSNLDKEPFTDYWKKLDSISHQAKVNNVQSPDDFANDIYCDLMDKKVAPFENPKFYKYIADTDEKLDIIIRKAYGIYSDGYISAFEKTGIDKKQKPLLIDPGIFNHLGELNNYVKENNIDTSEIEPWDLRRQFSEHLGKEVVYRGLYAKEPEMFIEDLKKNGNRAAAFKKKESAIEAIKYYIGEDDSTFTIFGRLSWKAKDKDDYSEFLSVSKIYDVAASVPKLWGNSASPVVVIKTEVPKIDLIEQKDYFANIQSGARHKELVIGRQSFDYDRRQSEIEGFVPFFLPTENAEITIDRHTPGFRWC